MINRRSLLRALGAVALAPSARVGSSSPRREALVGATVESLRSVGGLPAHIAGQFREPLAFEQDASGQYFVFDRLGHTVYGVGPEMAEAWKIVQIGHEAGRIIEPTAFGVAANGTFAVADRPAALERVQFFGPGGRLVGGFTLPGRASETVILGGLVLNGVGSLQYDGRAVFINLPETGALVAQFSPTGVPLRTFGTLRATGHEADQDVHLALNAGLPLIDPRGGFCFVFQTGTPAFRRYDPSGRLVFERHIEGREIDDVLAAQPTEWPRRRRGARELPLIPPVVRTARVDADGCLWVAFAGVPFTYVYDPSGDKVRVVEFRAAGLVMPTSLFFSPTGRLLVTPGCFAFTPAGPR